MEIPSCIREEEWHLQFWNVGKYINLIDQIYKFLNKFHFKNTPFCKFFNKNKFKFSKAPLRNLRFYNHFYMELLEQKWRSAFICMSACDVKSKSQYTIYSVSILCGGLPHLYCCCWWRWCWCLTMVYYACCYTIQCPHIH